MDDTTSENPAFTQQTRISPMLVEMVAKDPAYLNELERKMRVIQEAQVHQRLMAPDAPLGLKLQFIEMLGKTDAVLAKAKAAQLVGPQGPGFSVNIILGGDKKATSTVVIDTPTPEPLAE